MPQMSLSHKARLVSNYVYDARWREIYNMIFWVYPLWWNRKWSSFITNGIDLFPPFLEIEPTTACQYACVCCEHAYWNEPPKNISFENFKKIFDGFTQPSNMIGNSSAGINFPYLLDIKCIKARIFFILNRTSKHSSEHMK